MQGYCLFACCNLSTLLLVNKVAQPFEPSPLKPAGYFWFITRTSKFRPPHVFQMVMAVSFLGQNQSKGKTVLNCVHTVPIIIGNGGSRLFGSWPNIDVYLVPDWFYVIHSKVNLNGYVGGNFLPLGGGTMHLFVFLYLFDA